MPTIKRHSQITIARVRAYFHAHDDTHATHIEYSLCRPDGWDAPFEEGAWDYLCALYTPEVRTQILDRKVQRMRKRHAAGHNQFVVDCAKPKHREVLSLGTGTARADWHHVSMTPQNKIAAKAWFAEEMDRQTSALTIEQSVGLGIRARSADHMKIAWDARRRLDERIDALGIAIAYAQHPDGILPGDAPRALVASLKLDCARHLLDLSLMPATNKGSHANH
jgi:hypothetical protein